MIAAFLLFVAAILMFLGLALVAVDLLDAYIARRAEMPKNVPGRRRALGIVLFTTGVGVGATVNLVGVYGTYVAQAGGGTA